jgi:hypothetical protein
MLLKFLRWAHDGSELEISETAGFLDFLDLVHH